MNQTPRAVNRTVLVLAGLLFTLAGAAGLALAAFPGFAGAWQRGAAEFGRASAAVLDATTLPGQRDSWLWIVAAVAMIGLVLLMVWWVAVQGKGRTGVFARDYYDDGTRGIVELASAVPEQAVKAALGGRTDIVSTSVTAWEAGHDAGLRIKVQPRLGAAPYRIADDVSAIVSTLDAALGRSGPVVIHLAAGARTRMSRAERVR
ncbi:hypothetical protein ACQ3I4_09555 [Zafaria sp. Z1313]|uniref:hypothetical protein n=1 Tax=unclassified Zafaria TaxID=2828765 RepID=UPI002E79E516|nr:hypothetical protein [Zafaria sp. J156]MEE1621836.1 hypothetical protein [Zafaria sp. J156]